MPDGWSLNIWRNRFGLRMLILRHTRILALSLCGIFLLIHYSESEIVRGVRIPLRDGIHVVADYYLPDEPGQYTTILEITPYLRANIYGTYVLEYEHWNRNGYAFMVVDVRGLGDSEGLFDEFRYDTNDDYDILEWIVQQPWSDGKVGMRGASYAGQSQLYAASSGSPYVACITPSCGPLTTPAMEIGSYNSGIYQLKWSLEWSGMLSDSGVNSSIHGDWDSLLSHRPLYTADEAVFGKPSRLYRIHMEHETGDDYWKQVELDEEEYSKINVPSLIFTGWFDDSIAGSIQNFQGLKRYSPNPDKHFLIIGPWSHITAPDGGYDFVTGEPLLTVGDVTFPEHSLLPALNITTEFFNWCLRENSPLPVNSTATVYITGSNIWINLPDYPPQDVVPRKLYLSSSGDANSINGNGKLILEPPADEPFDEIVHDPSNPFKNYVKGPDGAYDEILNALPKDISQLLNRSDALVYATEPLMEPMTVLGNVRLYLHVSTDAYDADFHAVLEDVSPDGTAVKVGPRDGLAKARFRNRTDYSQSTPAVPGEPFELNINMYYMGHTFLAGHKLRLTVTSCMYPRTFPNPGTGKPVAYDTDEPLVARNRVYHNSVQLSTLVLPVYSL